MEELPEAVEAALVRAIGTYLRTADLNELPPQLKRYRGFRPQALARHKAELLRALDRGPMAALILQWLDEAKPSLAKGDAAILRSATDGTAIWEKEPAAEPETEPTPTAGGARPDDELVTAFERARDRASKARATEQQAKEALRRVTEDARLRQAAQSREITQLRAELSAGQKKLVAERTARAKAVESLERERRRARRDLEKERTAKEEALRALKLERRAQRAREAELSRLRRQLGAPREPAGAGGRIPPGGPDPTPKPHRRAELKAPPGLLEEDPKSLDRWLNAEGVTLLVDGYNVSKSVTGYAHLPLEDQRKSVVQAVNRLARRKGLKPIVVFDGAEVPPGTSRRGRGPAVVEYSSGETADDHLIARLEDLPPFPVVFVTNDKELQDRARALGATIATSDQLLALAR